MEIHAASINERVESIKENKMEIDRLIQEYKPFIASVVEGSAGKYVRYGEDDELSIGLIAFEESIRSYDRSKGNFLAFAKNVIKRRLIDYYRRENKHSKVVPLMDNCSNTESDDNEMDLGMHESIKIYSDKQIAEYRKDEIIELKEELGKWGLTFFDVAKSSPKHNGTRKIYMQVIDYITTNSGLLNTIKNKRYLPIAEIEKNFKIPRKKIERGRNYIIAVVLVKTGDFQYINSFVDWR